MRDNRTTHEFIQQQTGRLWTVLIAAGIGFFAGRSWSTRYELKPIVGSHVAWKIDRWTGTTECIKWTPDGPEAVSR